jgi:hypothetical protein
MERTSTGRRPAARSDRLDDGQGPTDVEGMARELLSQERGMTGPWGPPIDSGAVKGSDSRFKIQDARDIGLDAQAESRIRHRESIRSRPLAERISRVGSNRTVA